MGVSKKNIKKLQEFLKKNNEQLFVKSNPKHNKNGGVKPPAN